MRRFFNNSKQTAHQGGWPKLAIIAVLQERYASVAHLRDDEGFSLYGINDAELNFVMALVEMHNAPDQVVEVGFLTRFVGFDVHQQDAEFINRNLHISVAGLENGELFVVGGVEAMGLFDAGAFGLVLEAWKRDLMIVIHALQGGASMLSATPIGRAFKSATKFATNEAPTKMADEADGMSDLIGAYFGGGSAKSLCTDCNGRGKQGFIARTCASCDGVGMVKSSRF